jgi:hypothetical protein
LHSDGKVTVAAGVEPAARRPSPEAAVFLAGTALVMVRRCAGLSLQRELISGLAPGTVKG